MYGSGIFPGKEICRGRAGWKKGTVKEFAGEMTGIVIIRGLILYHHAYYTDVLS
jgi:hypothetical protein